jgi:hypothetical protein
MTDGIGMTYLLDADTLIKADNIYYPMKRFPIFWEWLQYNGLTGNVKVPHEQYDEIVAGHGELVDWLKDEEAKTALLLNEEVDADRLTTVVENGYAPDLDDSELEAVGRDPFLIAYALKAPANRHVITFEVSAPSRKRANRKIPDVCSQFGVPCGTLFQLIVILDFTTSWKWPSG